MARPRKKPQADAKGYMPDRQDELAKRINECEKVIEHINSCPAWGIIKKDCELQKQVIDDNWHLISKGVDWQYKLDELRVTKLAYVHLINIVDKYKEDLANCTKELEVLRNPKEKMIKDYDIETPLIE